MDVQPDPPPEGRNPGQWFVGGGKLRPDQVHAAEQAQPARHPKIRRRFEPQVTGIALGITADRESVFDLARRGKVDVVADVVDERPDFEIQVIGLQTNPGI